MLTGQDARGSGQLRSAPADRQAVLEILRDTKPDLPEPSADYASSATDHVGAGEPGAPDRCGPRPDHLVVARPLPRHAARLIDWRRTTTSRGSGSPSLTDTFGSRPSASENMARAVAWAAETMKADGLDNVRTERVMVPKWVRGAESAEIVEPPRHPMAMLGLGGTVATPPGGIEAEVVLVTSFDDLQVPSAPRSRAALSSSTSPTRPTARPWPIGPAARGPAPNPARWRCWCDRWARSGCARRTPAA